MRCVIFDIDGTLANNLHRAHHLAPGKPKNWPAYDALMHLDEPVPQLVELARILHEEYAIILCSGRKEIHREITRTWLTRHNVAWDLLYMRQTTDFRPDAIVKSELLDQILASGYEPQFVVDDRNSVVEMWRKRGLVCLQVAPGDF